MVRKKTKDCSNAGRVSLFTSRENYRGTTRLWVRHSSVRTFIPQNIFHKEYRNKISSAGVECSPVVISKNVSQTEMKQVIKSQFLV